MKHTALCPWWNGGMCNCPRGEQLICPQCETLVAHKRCPDCLVDAVRFQDLYGWPTHPELGAAWHYEPDGKDDSNG